MWKTNTLFVMYRCFNNVLRNTFAKQVYDTKKREDVHAACKKVYIIWEQHQQEITRKFIEVQIRSRCPYSTNLTENGLRQASGPIHTFNSVTYVERGNCRLRIGI